MEHNGALMHAHASREVEQRHNLKSLKTLLRPKPGALCPRPCLGLWVKGSASFGLLDVVVILIGSPTS